MRAVVQRVLDAAVSVDGECVGALDGPGLVALVGVTHDDGPSQVEIAARKIAELRIMAGEESVSDLTARGERVGVLVVSQFTLYGDVRKGRRPSWSRAAPGAVAEPLVDALAASLKSKGLRVETGRFGADMKVSLTNDGPFTVIIDV